jgi:hypothetical protein
MKLKDCITFSFKDALARIKAESALQASHYLILHHSDSTRPLWQQHLCTNSHFCRTVVANGYLTVSLAPTSYEKTNPLSP